MSLRDHLVRLRHMRDHARKAMAMAEGRERADLDDDYMLALALTRLVDTIFQPCSLNWRGQSVRNERNACPERERPKVALAARKAVRTPFLRHQF